MTLTHIDWSLLGTVITALGIIGFLVWEVIKYHEQDVVDVHLLMESLQREASLEHKLAEIKVAQLRIDVQPKGVMVTRQVRTGDSQWAGVVDAYPDATYWKVVSVDGRPDLAWLHLFAGVEGHLPAQQVASFRPGDWTFVEAGVPPEFPLVHKDDERPVEAVDSLGKVRDQASEPITDAQSSEPITKTA